IILASVLFAAGGMWIAKRVSRPLEDESKRQVTLVRVLGEPIQ
ncbi:SoxR reducing system RseC family protein, partial [Vibrio diabolicus]